MKTSTVVLLVLTAWSCGCAHTALTGATFFQEGAFPSANQTNATPNHLVLQITRHVDTIINGPDIDEDQRLILDLRNVRLQQRLPIPSAEAVPQLLVTRFGPSSKGKEFLGFVIVSKVTSNRAQAYLHLDVIAQTADGSYSQKVRFRGNVEFLRQTQDQDRSL